VENRVATVSDSIVVAGTAPKRGRGRPAFSLEKRAKIVLLGAWIRCQRESLGLTQTQVADCLGVTKAAVSSWENGIRLAPIDRLMVVLGNHGLHPMV